MIYNKDEIFDFCSGVLGSNCNGIFIHYDTLENSEDLPFALNDTFEDFLEKDFNEDLNCTIKAGATKLVIYPIDANYVIKLPITGVYCEVDNKDNDYYDHDVYNDDLEIIARATSSNRTIFEDEANIYKNTNNIAKEILLPNIYIGNINNIPIYIQEKIDRSFAYSSRFNHTLSKEEITKTQEILKKIDSKDNGEYLGCASTFLYDIIKYYGGEKSFEICKLIDQLNDLHTGNYGYLNNAPKIFDYGGFYSDDAYWNWD